MRRLLMLMALSGCAPMTTPEGCTIFATELMRAQTDACVRAYHEEQARQRGAQITRCYGSGGETTCITG